MIITNVLLARESELALDKGFEVEWERATKDCVDSNPLWDDPFAQTLKMPDKDPHLTWKLLKTWTEQMWHGSMAFPNYVGYLLGRVKPHIAGRSLAINAAVERGYPDESRSHYMLAVDLLRTMGLAEDEIAAIPILPESRDYIYGHLAASRDGDLIEAVGLLGLGIEALTTKEFSLLCGAYSAVAEKMGPVRNPIQATKSLGYFYENVSADIQHASEFMEIAWALYNTPPEQRAYRLGQQSGEPSEQREPLDEYFMKLRTGANRSLTLRRNFFNGVYREASKTD